MPWTSKVKSGLSVLHCRYYLGNPNFYIRCYAVKSKECPLYPTWATFGIFHSSCNMLGERCDFRKYWILFIFTESVAWLFVLGESKNKKIQQEIVPETPPPLCRNNTEFGWSVCHWHETSRRSLIRNRKSCGWSDPAEPEAQDAAALGPARSRSDRAWGADCSLTLCTLFSV